MNMKTGLKFVLFGLVTILFAGCATPIDWNSRIGHYTYDQAIGDYGPPDKQARLTDGKLVVEWITRYNNGGSAVFVGSGVYPGQVGVVQTFGPSYYESILRLTFDTHYVLYAWTKK